MLEILCQIFFLTFIPSYPIIKAGGDDAFVQLPPPVVRESRHQAIDGGFALFYFRFMVPTTVANAVIVDAIRESTLRII